MASSGLSVGAVPEGRRIGLYSVYAVYCIARLYTHINYQIACFFCNRLFPLHTEVNHTVTVRRYEPKRVEFLHRLKLNRVTPITNPTALRAARNKVCSRLHVRVHGHAHSFPRLMRAAHSSPAAGCAMSPLALRQTRSQPCHSHDLKCNAWHLDSLIRSPPLRPEAPAGAMTPSARSGLPRRNFRAVLPQP